MNEPWQRRALEKRLAEPAGSLSDDLPLAARKLFYLERHSLLLFEAGLFKVRQFVFFRPRAPPPSDPFPSRGSPSFIPSLESHPTPGITLIPTLLLISVYPGTSLIRPRPHSPGIAFRHPLCHRPTGDRSHLPHRPPSATPPRPGCGPRFISDLLCVSLFFYLCLEGGADGGLAHC